MELVGVSDCDMQGDLIREERVSWDTATLLAGAGVLGSPSRPTGYGFSSTGTWIRWSRPITDQSFSVPITWNSDGPFMVK